MEYDNFFIFFHPKYKRTEALEFEISQWFISNFIFLMSKLDLEASEPKWVNHVFNIIGVNSFRLGGLHLYISLNCLNFLKKSSGIFYLSFWNKILLFKLEQYFLFTAKMYNNIQFPYKYSFEPISIFVKSMLVCMYKFV